MLSRRPVASAPPDVMSLQDVASYLQISLRTAGKLAKAGDLPVKKIGKQYRCHRDALDRWLQRDSETSFT